MRARVQESGPRLRIRRPRCDEPVPLMLRFKSLCAWAQRLLRSAPRRFFNNGVRLRRTARARVDWTAGRSMQPLRRFRPLGLRADSKAFARRRKRPGTEPAALVHCVPAALDPTNVGLDVVDVVRNEIIHRDHLTDPRAVGELIYIYREMTRWIVMDRRIYFWFTRELAAGHIALRWAGNFACTKAGACR